MKTTFVVFLYIVASLGSSIAQKQEPPVFVMLEDVLVTADDPRFAPLFYTLTGNGKGSFVSDLFEPVLSGQLVAVSDIWEKVYLTQYEVKDLLFDTQRDQDEWGNELDTVVSGDEDRYTFKNILAFRLYFMTCYDKDMKLISRSFIGLMPLNCEKDAENKFRGWRRTIYFSAKYPEVQNILKKKCALGAFQKMSYLVFFNQIPVDELTHEAHYISFEKANYFSGNFPYKTPSTSEFELPSIVAANAKLIEKEFTLNEADFLLTPVFENSFFKLENGPEKIKLNYNADISDIPMFFGDNKYGYINVVQTVLISVENGNDVFSAVFPDDVFREQLSFQEAGNKLAASDTIIRFDPLTGNQINSIITHPVEITALKILLLQDDKNVFPVAVCLERLNHNDEGTPIGTTPLLWIPVNKQLITEFESYQAYLPGYPQQLTLWGYLLSGMYKGNIISERPIDNAEWQKMLEVLR